MAGDPAYYDVRNEFYENTDGVLLVFDVGSRRSLENVRDRWLAEMALHLKCDKTEVLSTCQAVLVGNKVGKRLE